MKKELGIVIGSILMIAVLLLGMMKNKEEKREEPIFEDITYEFSGSNENFEFRTGKVFFDGPNKRIYVDDFKQKKKLKNIKDIRVIFSFGEEESIVESLDDKISTIAFYEGDVCDENMMACEITPFDEATEENFKEIFKVKIEYCIEEKCFSEPFTIQYN